MTSNPHQDPGRAFAATAFASHDHSTCIATVLAAVEERCAEEGLRFTPVRRKVLELLLQDHKALGAYAILDKLREAGFRSQPPVAYRALDFLTKHGFAYKIERINAFVASTHPHENQAPAFMICKKCDAVAETYIESIDGSLQEAARGAGFEIERTVVEAEGVCLACSDTSSA